MKEYADKELSDHVLSLLREYLPDDMNGGPQFFAGVMATFAKNTFHVMLEQEDMPEEISSVEDFAGYLCELWIAGMVTVATDGEGLGALRLVPLDPPFEPREKVPMGLQTAGGEAEDGEAG